MYYQPGSSRENFSKWAQDPEALKENVWAFLGAPDRIATIPKDTQAAFIEGAIDFLDRSRLGCLEVLVDFESIENFPNADKLRELALKKLGENFSLNKDTVHFILDNFEKILIIPDSEEKLIQLIENTTSKEILEYFNKEILKRGLNRSKTFYKIHTAVTETLLSIKKYERGIKERLDEMKEISLPDTAYHITTKNNWEEIQRSGHIHVSEGAFFPGKKVSMTAALDQQDIDFAVRVVMETQGVSKDELMVIPVDVSRLNLDTTDMHERKGRSEVWSDVDIPLDAVDQSAVVPLSEFKK